MGEAKLSLDDLGRRLESGLSIREAVARTRKWWDGAGRRLFANPEWRDPELGLLSGITRGLAFDELALEEAAAVTEHWHEHHVMALVPAEFRRGNPGAAARRGNRGETR
jgi:hypothetical protein